MQKKSLKAILWIVTTVIMFFALGVAIFPKFVSTNKGRELTLQLINHRIEGKLSVEALSLNWFSGQRIENFQLIDCNGTEIVSFKSFTTDQTLIGALFGRFRIGDTKLISPHLFLTENAYGKLNVDHVLKIEKKKESKKKEFRLPRFKGSMSIQDGLMTLSSSQVTTPIILSDFYLEARDSFSRFHLEGKTNQGNNQGALLAYGQCCKNVQIMACVNNFPVGLLDQIKESKVYEPALGNSLNLNLELVKKDDNVLLEAKISSQNLEGTFKGWTKDKIFHLEEGHIVFTVTPSFFKELLNSKEWHLANRPEMVIDIEKLILPVQMKKPNFREIPFLGKMTLQRAEMTHTDLGILSLNDFKADFATTTSADNSYVDLKYSASIQGKGDATSLGGNVKIYSDQSIDFFTSFKSLPTDVLELVLSADLPYLHKILGPQFSLDFSGKYDEGLDSNIVLHTANFDVQGTIKGDDLENLTTKLDGNIFTPVRYKPYVGSDPQMHIEADLSFSERVMAIPALRLEIKNSHFDFDMLGHIGEKGKCFNYKDIELTGVGKIQHLPVAQGNLDYHGRFLFKFDGARNVITANAHLGSQSQTDESLVFNFSGKDLISNNSLDIHSGKLDMSTKIKDFPVAFFDIFMDEKGKLEPFIGQTFGMNADLHKTPGKEEPISSDIEIKAQGFSLDMALLMNGGFSISPSKPATLKWDLTPERYRHLIQLIGSEKEIEYTLDHDTTFTLVVEKFACAKLPPNNLEAFICDGGLVGKITAEPLVFIDSKTSDTLVLKNIAAQVFANDVSKNISIDLSSDLSSTFVPHDVLNGFSFKLHTLNLLTPEGAFNKENFAISGEINLDHLPVSQMTAILPLKAKTKQTMRALLGSLVNARIYGEISKLTGPLTIDIKASNFKGIFPLNFNNESLTLQKNVEAELTLTEEVNAILLKDITPILISGAWSDHPLKLYIDAQGFYVPLRPFSFKDLRVEKAVLDLGRVRVKNGGEILSLMKFLKAKDVSSEGIMEAWFTPIFISLKDGVAVYKRFDAMLAGNVHIAMWGGIDIINDRVGMTLGISPVTLQRNFDIMGMSNKDMFQVKMRGSTGKLDLDWTSAYTRIGLILTRTAGGHIGYIIGGILEQLVGLLGEEKTPDPTTSPFPWEKSQKEAKPEEGIPKEVSIKGANAGLRKILNILIP